MKNGLMTCFTLRTEQVFLSHLDGKLIYESIRHKIELKEELTEEELLQLIILPLTDKGKEKKQERIQQVVELAKEIREEKREVAEKLIFDGLEIVQIMKYTGLTKNR